MRFGVQGFFGVWGLRIQGLGMQRFKDQGLGLTEIEDLNQGLDIQRLGLECLSEAGSIGLGFRDDVNWGSGSGVLCI